MSTFKSNTISNDRQVGITFFDDGYLSFTPSSEDSDTPWPERLEHFKTQSLQPYPIREQFTPAWSPAYITTLKNGSSVLRADLMVFDLHGCHMDDVLQFLSDNLLAGVVHGTKSGGLTSPRCRVILLLDRAINHNTYTSLWRRIAHEVFDEMHAPAHADCRQRFNSPHCASNRPGKSTMRSSQGYPIYVDGALAAEHLHYQALGNISADYAEGYESD